MIKIANQERKVEKNQIIEIYLRFCDNDKKKERETISAIVKKGSLKE
jgi:hypothetical protein